MWWLRSQTCILPPPALVKLSAARTNETGLAVKFMFDLMAKGASWPAPSFPPCRLGVNSGGIFKFGSNVTRIIYRWFKVDPPLTSNLGVLLHVYEYISVYDCYADRVHASYTNRGPAQWCGTQHKK